MKPKKVLFPISRLTGQNISRLFLFFFVFFFFFAHDRKNPRPTPDNPSFDICLFQVYILCVPIFHYFRSSSFVDFFSSIAGFLQARPSTIVQFLSK